MCLLSPSSERVGAVRLPSCGWKEQPQLCLVFAVPVLLFGGFFLSGFSAALGFAEGQKGAGTLVLGVILCPGGLELNHFSSRSRTRNPLEDSQMRLWQKVRRQTSPF